MKKNTKKLLYVFFILVMIISAAWFYVDYTNKNNNEEEVPEVYEPTPSEIDVDDKDKESAKVESLVIKMAPDVDLAEERRKNNNNDIVGRLEIPDLFNVLVVKTTNNDYYLNHAVNKSYDIRGSEFLDYRVNPTSKQVNIYGHNSRDPNIKVAFLKLESYLKKDFFDNNPYIIFQYDGGKSIYKIKAIKEVYETNTEHLLVDKTGSDFVNHVNTMTTGNGIIFSRDVKVDANSEILVLQTCSHHWNNALYTFIAVKIDY
ncbi:MAG: class B sortase [Bacilli bacterium]|nr:class B sortase [Bacilli bacterium]